MALFTRTFLFIMPDKSGILKFNQNAIYRTDIDGTNQTTVLAGNFWSKYTFNESTGFLYVIERTSGNAYRNDTAFDFTAFSSVGSAITSSPVQVPSITFANAGRIVFGTDKVFRYTDNSFSSYSNITFSFGTYENIWDILYEGSDFLQLITVDAVSTDQKFYRSTDNGLTWTQFSNPEGSNSSFITPIKI